MRMRPAMGRPFPRFRETVARSSMGGACSVSAEPPPPLLGYDDDALISVFARVPFFSHGNVRCVCRRANALLTSPAFREERISSGWAEHGLVVAGGYDVRRRGAVADCALLAGGRWRSIARLRAPRDAMRSAVFEGELWLIGGIDDAGEAVTSVDIYNPQSNAWRSGPSPGAAVRDPAVCGVVGGSLVVAGGISDDEPDVNVDAAGDAWEVCGPRAIATAEAYSPATGWTRLPSMPRPADPSAVACDLDGRLYVAPVVVDMGTGGFECDWLLMFDGARWTREADLPEVRGMAACAAHGGRLIFIGGIVDGCETETVVSYDPGSNVWEKLAPLPEPRSGCLQGMRAIEHLGAIFLVGNGEPLRFADGVWEELRRLPDGEEGSLRGAELKLGTGRLPFAHFEPAAIGSLLLG